MTDLKSRLMKVALVVLGITMAGSLWAQQSRTQIISERIAGVDNVCLAGEPCAASTSTAATSTAATSAAAASTSAATTLAQADTGFDAADTYRTYCAMCHDSGMANAPLLGDDSFWSARLDEVGYDTILLNAINGINAMPPRGMCMDCSDEELDELVVYLLGDVL